MVFEPLLPPIDVPVANVAEYVLGECRRRADPDHAVLVDSASGEALAVEQLVALVRRFARGVRASGIRPGEAVCVFAANSIYYPFVAYGIVAAGAVCAPANPMYTPRELAHQLSDMGCRAIVVGDGLQDTVDEAQRLAGITLDRVWAMDETKSRCERSVFLVADAAASDADGGDGRIALDSEPPAPTATAYMCCSSGTTGRPKCVVLTHRNMIANAMQINAVKTLDLPTATGRKRETFLGLAPFCHAYGLSYVLHSAVMLGGRVVVMRRYSLEALLAAVEQHRITYAYLVPPIVNALSKDPLVDSRDLSSMHTVLSGGAALSPTLITTTEQRLPGLRVIQGYGMTEMSPAMTMLSTSHRRPASIGIL
ncbi:4-coumarate--CoA ligase, partial [Coemansia helicoidea]